MGTSNLKQAFVRGEPLVDVVVRFRSEIDAQSTTERINSLAEDFELNPRPWYNDPSVRIGTATREALERMFGWKLRRARVLNTPDDRSNYWWEELAPPCRFPLGLEEVIDSLGLSQPGSNDDGQWYE